MEQDTQDRFVGSVLVGKTTVELIQQRDLHRWVYLNGHPTDVRHPRHINVNMKIKTVESLFRLSKDFVYGKSVYNKIRIKELFKKNIPRGVHMNELWKYAKNYPYWQQFKRDTWYYFHPISHMKDAKRFWTSEDPRDCDYSYNEHLKEKEKKK